MRLALLGLVTACGRIGFDSTSERCATEAPYGNSSEGPDGITTPFLICTADQLDQIGQHPEHWASTFLLAADLDVAGRTITMIGDETTPFTGTFDGGDHTIANLAYDLPAATNVGLFSVTANGALIGNLHLEAVTIDGQENVGGLVGYAHSLTIDSVAVTGAITGATSVGGVIGAAECHVAGCAITLSNLAAAVHVTATVVSGGGIIGYTYSGSTDQIASLSRLTSSGTIEGGQSIGGIVGDLEMAVLDASDSVATIHAQDRSGGLVGVVTYYPSQITASSASGTVTCVAGDCGGLVGSSQGSVIRSHASGTVTCGDLDCGGLAGDGGLDIAECYASGDVTGIDQVGGLVGELNGVSLRDSYATGAVSGRDRVGGLFGIVTAPAAVIAVYSISPVTGRDSVGGIVGQAGPTTTIHIDHGFVTGHVTGMSAANHVDQVAGNLQGIVQASQFYFVLDCTNTLGPCFGIGIQVPDPTIFYSSLNAPVSLWDFANVWQEVPNAFPRLRH